MSASSDVPAPTFLGMVICDNIIQDPETKKYFLLGTLTGTMAREFPARYAKLCIYAALSGIRERTGVSVRLVFADPKRLEDVEIMTIQGAVDATDPLATAELTLSLRYLPFPQPGDYRFQLWSNGALLGERKFAVRSADRERQGL